VKDGRKKSVDAILRSETGRFSYAREILREGRWRCDTGSERTYLAGPETITKKITKTADATSYWILYYTAVKDQTSDNLEQNITKNPVQYLISNIRKYSIEANKTE